MPTRSTTWLVTCPIVSRAPRSDDRWSHGAWEAVVGTAVFVASSLLVIGIFCLSGAALDSMTGPGRPFAAVSWLAVAIVWSVIGAVAVAVWRVWHGRLDRSGPIGAATAASPSEPGSPGQLDDTVVGHPRGSQDSPDPPTRPADAPASGRMGEVAVSTVETRSGPAARGLQVVGEAAVVVAVILLLVGRSPQAWVDGWIGSVDTKYYGWLAWRLSEMSTPSLRLDGVVHPGGLDLILLDGLGPITLSGIGVRLFGRWLGYNLVVAGGLAGNYLGARHLGRVVAGRREVAIACGLAYLACPMFVGPVGSFPSLLWAGVPPLLLAESIRVARGDIPVHIGRIAGLLAAAYLCSIYHLVFGALAAGLVGLSWPASRLRRAPELKRAMLGVLAALVVLSPFIVARLAYTGEERDAGASTSRQLDDAIVFSADSVDPLALPPDGAVLPDGLRLGIGTRPLEIFRTAGLGGGLIVGTGLGAATLVRRRRRTSGGAVAMSAGIMWLLCLGPVLTAAGNVFGPQPGRGEWLPYRLLLAVPGLAALRAPYRASMALAAVCCALMALGLYQLPPKARRGAFGVVLLAGVLSWWPATATSRVDPPKALTDSMATMEASDPGRTGAVMVVPFTCGFDDLDVMNWQPTHERAMVVCGVSQSATRWFTRLGAWFRSSGFAAVSCTPETTVLGSVSDFAPSTVLDDSGIDELRDDFDVRWLLFDRQRAPGCRTADATLTALADAPVLADDGRFLLIDLGPATP